MMPSRHTAVGALVIASFVALQGILFLGTYESNGVAHTEEQAIAYARAICPRAPAFMATGWRAKLRGDRWVAVAVERDGLFREEFGGAAEVAFDARTGKLIDCRVIGGGTM